MRAVLEFLAALVDLLKLWLRQRYGERREAARAADRTAVRDDAGGEWVRHSGGTDLNIQRNLILPITGQWYGIRLGTMK